MTTEGHKTVNFRISDTIQDTKVRRTTLEGVVEGKRLIRARPRTTRIATSWNELQHVYMMNCEVQESSSRSGTL